MSSGPEYLSHFDRFLGRFERNIQDLERNSLGKKTRQAVLESFEFIFGLATTIALCHPSFLTQERVARTELLFQRALDGLRNRRDEHFKEVEKLYDEWLGIFHRKPKSIREAVVEVELESVKV